MNLPFPSLHLPSALPRCDSEAIHFVPRTDVQWGGPIFKAPALPTPHQLSSDLPFSVNFSSKARPRRRGRLEKFKFFPVPTALFFVGRVHFDT